MQGSVRLSFPGLEQEIAAEGTKAVASMYHLDCETHRSGPHSKCVIAQTVHERMPAEQSCSLNPETQNGEGLQILQDETFQQRRF